MDFSTRFVCTTREYSTFERQIPAPCFRKEFELKNFTSARLRICGLGFYELYVNGKKITRGLLSPYISNPDDYLYYDEYDLMPYLNEGMNVIGVMLGNGLINNFGGQVWRFDKARFRSSPKLALSFEAVISDDEKLEFDATSGFVCHESPIITDDLRAGEFYDARLELGAWTEVGYDDSEWRATISAETPRGECRIANVDPILPAKELSPVLIKPGKITYFADPDKRLPVIPIPEDEENIGGYIYDFGLNSAGLCRLHIKNARPGQKIVMQFGEWLAEDGGLDLRAMTFLPTRFNHRAIYICRGDEEEIYMPSFTYFGFRYCLVMGIDESQATDELLTYVVMNSDIKSRASFSCSDEMTNRLWDAAIVSDLANFYHFPTDCPHREKNGWTGDVSVSAEQMLMSLTVERNLGEWMYNVRKNMNDNGFVSGIVPSSGWGYGHGTAWDKVVVDVPYYVWLYRGNTNILKENATAIFRYINHLAVNRNSKGLLDYGLGDWCQAGRSIEPLLVSREFTGTLMGISACKRAAKIFEVLCMKEQKTFAESVAAGLRESVRNNLIDKAALVAYDRCQTSQALAIYYDIFDGGEKYIAAKKLVEMIEEQNRFECGMIGMRVLFHVLADYGYTDLAFKLITREEHPSYGYMIANGATSLWEIFQRKECVPSSKNHHFFGDIISWFMKNLAGININPYQRNANEIMFRPRFIDALDHAMASYDAPLGTVRSEWRRDGEDIICKFAVPSGVVAEFVADSGFKCEDGMTHKKLSGDCELRLIRGNKRDKHQK